MPRKVIKVTARLAQPVATWGVLHLDGILWGVKGDPLPLASVSIGGAACYIASAALWPEDVQIRQQTILTREDPNDPEVLRHDLSFCGLEGAALKIPVYHADHVQWLVTTEAVNDLRDLLQEVPAIGAYQGFGFGKVAEWRLEERKDVLPVDCLIGPDMILRRHLPSEWHKLAIKGETGRYRPPYWLMSKNRRLPAWQRTILKPSVLAAVCSL